MNRRQSLKLFSALGAGIFLPKGYRENRALSDMQPLHFVALGYGGARILSDFIKLGAKGNFCVINDEMPEDLIRYREVGFIPFHTRVDRYEIKEFLVSDSRVILPQEVADFFKNGERYVLLTELGGLTGTVLLHGIMQANYPLPFKTFTTLPFQFEGSLKFAIAHQFHQHYKYNQNICFVDNHSLMKTLGNIRINKAFQVIHEKLFAAFNASGFALT